MKYFKLTILVAIIGLSSIVLVNSAKADYYQEGVVLSTDLLSGISDEAWITGFTATSSVPASTTVGFLFSVDQENWYNSEGGEGIWDTMASGTTYFDLKKLKWATSTLATTSLEFWYKARLTTNIATVTPIVFSVSVEYSDTYNYTEPDYGYYQEGFILSTDLLTGVSGEAWITGFTATSSVPASTSVGFLFSVDQENWYNAEGGKGIWDTMASGTTHFDLRALKWATSTLATSSLEFWYRARLTSNIATRTPIVYSVSMEYSDTYNYTEPDYGYYGAGQFYSNILINQPALNVEYFGYDLSALPSGTWASIQFSTTTERWYDASGTLWASSTLLVGDHLATSTGFDLTALGWQYDLYYKIHFDTSIASVTPALASVKAYYTERPPIEFSCIVDPDSGAGADFSSLSLWETAIQADLTDASSTQVYSYIAATYSGTIADAATVVGETSGAIGTVAHLKAATTGSSTGLIMIKNITNGKFHKDEKIYVQGATTNYIYITTSGDYVIAVAQCRSTGGSADTAAVTISDWTTATSTYIKIWTDPDDVYGRHNGKWNTNTYRLSASNDNILKIEEAYVRVDGLQIEATAIDGADECGINVDLSTPGGGGEWQVSNNIIKGVNGGSQNYHDGLRFINMTAAATAKVWNNVVYNFESNSNSVGIDFYDDDLTAYAYNNTVNNCDAGYIIYGGTAYARNNIANDITLAGYDFLSTTGGTWHSLSGNNISSDWTAPGTNSMTTTTVDFISTSTEDYHLSIADTSARKAGTTSVDSLFTTDIDGEERSGAWDIGADEIVYTAYRSVGNTEADLKTSASTVTISTYAGTSTAVFSAGQPDNVGVGDVIEYGTPAQITFIISRTSSSTFRIQGGWNNLPTATSSAACSIYRAFELLDDWEDHLEEDVNSSIDASVDEDVIIGLDLVASNTLMMVPCYGDAADSAAVVIGGWTTGASTYIKIYTPVTSDEVGESQRHNGKWGTSGYILTQSGASYNIEIDDENVKLIGLQIEYTGTWTSGTGIRASNNGDFEIANNIIRSTGSADYAGIYVSVPGGMEAKIYNNIIYGFNEDSGSYGIAAVTIDSASAYCYNNTVINCYTGIDTGSQDTLARNNIVQDCTNGYDGTFYTGSDNNISDLASDNTGGDNDLNDTTVTFVDLANKDFHLAPTSAGIDQGTSSVSDIVTHDIDGTPIHTYDIGADDASVYFEPKVVDQTGSTAGEFSSLSSWETGVQCDLTATTTLVFSISTSTGWIPIGSNVYGTSSFAVASTTIVSTSSNQILLYNIASSTFQSGEWVCLDGATANCVRLSNAGNPAIAVAKIDGAWSSEETSELTIAGWETSKYNYIKIYTTETARHNGKWSDNKYRNRDSDFPLAPRENNIVIDGLQLECSGGGFGIDIVDGGDDIIENVIISNNIIKSTNSGSTNGISIREWAYLDNVKIFNNIIYDFGNGGIYIDNDNSLETTDFIYNNTIYNNAVYGIRISRSGSFVKNNLVQNCGTDYAKETGTFSSLSSNNISSDWTSDLYGGTGNITSTTVAFLDSTNDDFHLDPDDTAARDAGVSLFHDATSSFSTDIDGTSRGGAWDIGADELPTEFVSVICENSTAGGDCSTLDYNNLSSWESSVDSDITASTTRVFSGTGTGDLSGNPTVTFIYPNFGTTTVTGTIVATTSDQILISGITGTTTPLIGVMSSKLWVTSANYWTISTTTEVSSLDAYGASPIAIAKIDGSWSASDTSAVNISGWTTDNDNYIKIYTTDAARHQGKWDEGKYRLEITTNSYPINILEEYTRVDGLQVKYTSDTYNNIGLIRVVLNSEADIKISHNIIKDEPSGSATGHIGILASADSSAFVYVWNNIVYDFINGSNGLYGIYSTGANFYAYNNTVYNCWRAYYQNGGTYIAKNNIAASSTANFWGAFDNSSTNNASDDSSNASSTADFIDQTFTFVDVDNDDFHLAQDDAGARDLGIDLSNDPYLNFTTDIDGYTRPYNGTWDIGADEYSMAVIYRSVGPGSTGALQCGAGTNSMSVSSSTSITNFQSPITDTIGVGDIIVYNASSSILVISGRTSSTTYTVKQTNGSNPSADVSSDTGWCIFRAYTSLSDAESGQENTGIPDAVENFDDWNPSQADEESRDLVANHEQWNIACYGDPAAGSSGASAPDTTAVTINGWTTGENNYLKVYTPVDSDEVGVTQRHTGKIDSTKYLMRDTDNVYAIYVEEDFVRIDGLQFEILSHNVDYAGGIRMESSIAEGAKIYISNSIFKGQYTGTSDGRDAIEMRYYGTGDSNHYAVIWNNIIYGFISPVGDSCDGIQITSGWHATIYNNTIFNSYDGIAGVTSRATLIAKNNIVQGSLINDYDNDYDPSSGNNISSDWTAPGDDSLTTTTVTFVDLANKDFHLAPTSAGIDQGTSSVSDIVTHDIDGTPIHTYDIGADDASVYFEPSVMQTGGEFSSLSSWETGVQCDLTATTTLVFSIDSSVGWIPIGSNVYGTSSFAVASTTIVSTSSNQILLYNIASSTFQSGEWVCLEGAPANCVRLSNAGNPAIAVAKIDGAWSSTDSGNIEIDGWTTGKYNYIRIYTTDTARHNGKWDDTKYIIYESSDARVFDIINEDYISIEGIQMKTSDTNGASWNDGIRLGSNFTENDNLVSIKSCIIRGGDALSGNGIEIAWTRSYINLNISNSIIYNFGDRGLEAQGSAAIDTNKIYLYNCTISGNDRGVGTGWGAYVVSKNCAVFDNSNEDFYNPYQDQYHCASDDGDGDYPVQPADWTAVFEDYTNGDFHLKTTDTDLKDAGTSTILWDTTLSFWDDIDGTARGGAWDIGADEVPVEYVSTICETTGSGGDCANLDYSTLSTWEAAVDSDITASTTRVFSGAGTGDLSGNPTVTFIYPNFGTTTVTGTVVATTSDQILISGISGTTTPLIGTASSTLWVTDSNYWTISTTTEVSSLDAYGASPIAIAKIDGSWSASDTLATTLSITDWTTDNDNYIKIYTTSDARHPGKWDYTKYRIVSDDVNNIGIRVFEEYFKLDGIQFKYKRTGSVNALALYLSIDNIDAEHFISNNIIWGDTSGINGTGGCRAINSSFEDLGKINVWNNIVYDFTCPVSSSLCEGILLSRPNTYVYSNTIYNCDSGIRSSSFDAIVAKNNLVASSTTCYGANGFHESSYNNASGDSTSASSTTDLVSQTFTFVDVDNNDFHLAPTDAGARDAGTDLSSDAYLSFTTDIDGYTRPYNGVWDIGADEYSMAVIYRSVGPSNTGTINCAATGGNMSISSSTSLATFTIGLADTIGVGDAIVYNASTSILFISGRTSSTTYTVKTVSGNNPSDVTGDSGWCIFRAYTSLSDAESGQENTGIPDAVENFDDWNPSQADEEGRDLVNNYEQWNIACYGDAVDTSAVTINGWTTGENNYLKVYTPVDFDEVGVTQRHTGKWNTSGFIINVSGSNEDAIEINDDNVHVKGLQLIASGLNAYAIDYNGGGVSSISNNIVKDTYSDGINGNGILTNATLNIYNNIVYDTGGEGIYIDEFTEAGIEINMYNNTVVNHTTIGIFLRASAGFTINLANNIVQGLDTNYSILNIDSSDGNIADDYTTPNSEFSTTTVTFVDLANKDFHLAPTSAGIDQGTSSVITYVITDIDGTPIHEYDIGADDASVYFDPTVMESGGDFTSLASWETANQVDLTATTTLTFTCSTINGWWPVGSSVVGTTSGAVASSTVMSTSSSKILLYNIASSTFQTNEKVIIEGTNGSENYCILSNAGNPAIAVAKIDGAWSSTDGGGYINGWETSEYNYIKIYTTDAARHNGKWDDNKFRLIESSSHAIRVYESYIVIDGLQFEISGSNDEIKGISINTASFDAVGERTVSNCIFKSSNTGTTGVSAISINHWDKTGNFKIFNNIIYDYYEEGIYTDLDSDSELSIYNNTIYNISLRGIHSGSGEPILKNNIVQNCGTDYYSSNNSLSDYNISSDWTAPGSNSFTTTTVSFLDSTNDDFHLDPDDTAAKDAGISLFHDATSSFSTDIDGTSRGGAWDIGADELPTEFESLIVESGKDYNSLFDWEADVNSDIASSATRVFSGYMTGFITDSGSLYLVEPNYATTSVTGNIVASTTGGQILVNNITGTSTPLVAIASGTKWCDDTTACADYWTIQGTGDALGASPIAIAKIDGTWNATDTAVVDIDDWQTSHDTYIKIYTTSLARHDGKWNYNKYRLVDTADDWDDVIGIYNPNVHIYGLQLENQMSGNPDAIDIYGNNGNFYIGYNIIRTFRHGIRTEDTSNSSVYIYNNIFIDTAGSGDGSGVYGYHNTLENTRLYIYNNTFIKNDGNYSAVVIQNTNYTYLYNNIVQELAEPGTGNCFYLLTTGGEVYYTGNNIASDNTSPDDAFDSKTVNFVSTSTGDFHLDNTDVEAKDMGIDVSGTSTLAFSDDIDGYTRPYNGIWDIGADEFSMAVIYRSVGPSNTGTINCAATGGNMSISSSTSLATFTIGLADTIGVGDAIVYNASTSILFISGRTSSTTYTVKTVSGNNPSDVTDDSGWCIFRAYTSLSDAESGQENTGIPDAVENFDDWNPSQADEEGRDLVAGNEQWNIACYGDAADTDDLIVAGWTTGPDNYLKIYTPVTASEVGTTQRHTGKWDTSKYHMQYGGSYSVIDSQISHIRIEGLQIYLSQVTSGNVKCIWLSSEEDTVEYYVSNNIVRGITDSDYSYHGGIHVYSPIGDPTGTAYVWNNIAYDFNESSGSLASALEGYEQNITTYFYNNTVLNSFRCIYSDDSAVPIIRNNIVQDCGDGYSGTFSSLSGNNITDLNESMAGSDNKTQTEVIFWDKLNNNYHLSPEDKAAIDAGTSSVSVIVSQDIDGTPIHTYDIGADDASVYFDSTVMETGGDFTSLSSWEAANQVDLTATTTLTFTCSTVDGWWPVGSNVVGYTSGTIASSTVMSTSTSKILLYNISVNSASTSAFISGERVYIDGSASTSNYCNLSNAGNSAIASAKIDGAWTGADESAVTIQGWTTGEYNYIRVYTTDTARHQGKWNTTKYILDGGHDTQIQIEEHFVRIDGLQINLDLDYESSRIGIEFQPDTSGGYFVASNNIIREEPGESYVGRGGINAGWLSGAQSRKIDIYNNIVYDFDNASAECIEINDNDWDSYVFNNTVYGCSDGIQTYSDLADNTQVRNNLVQNCLVSCFSGGVMDESGNNVSSDTSAPGANSKTNTTVTFRDAANDDFRLDTEDAGARDAGTNLSADTNLHFTTDIEGDTRYDAKWDIGADEAPTIIYRSVGNDTNNLATSGTSVTIATTTATFSANMAANIGVGDTLQYGGSGYYELAFITGRTSSTSYEVQSATGSIPVATTSASVSIFRAHEFLDDWEDQEIVDVNDGIDESVDQDVLVAKQDLTASNTTMFVPCYASTSADNLPVNIYDWNTATSNYIKIYTPTENTEVGESQRFNGDWDTSKFRISHNGIFQLSENYIRIDGIQREIIGSALVVSAFSQEDWAVNSGSSDIQITNTRIRGTSPGSAANNGIYVGGAIDIKMTIWNTIIENIIIGHGFQVNNDSVINIYNSTIYNCENGISEYGTSPVVTVKNTVVFSTNLGPSSDFYGSITIENCASDEGIGINAINLASSTTIWDSAFTDYINGDFSIKDYFSPLYDSGTNIVIVDDDIIGTTRPRDKATDVGAFEFTGLIPKYRLSPGGEFDVKGTIKFK